MLGAVLWLIAQLPPQFQDLGRLETRDLRLIRRHGLTWVSLPSPFRAEGERFVLEAEGASFPEKGGISLIGGTVRLRQDSLQIHADSLYLLPGTDTPFLFVGHVMVIRSQDTLRAECLRYSRDTSWMEGRVQVVRGTERSAEARASRARWTRDTLMLLPYPSPVLTVRDTPPLHVVADTLRLMQGTLQADGDVELWHAKGTGIGRHLAYRTGPRKGVLLGDRAVFEGDQYRMEAETLRFLLGEKALRRVQGQGKVQIQTGGDSLFLQADTVRVEWNDAGEVARMEARGGITGWLKTSSP